MINSSNRAAAGCTVVHWNYLIINWDLSEPGFVQGAPASNLSQANHRVHQASKLLTVLVSESP